MRQNLQIRTIDILPAKRLTCCSSIQRARLECLCRLGLSLLLLLPLEEDEGGILEDTIRRRNIGVHIADHCASQLLLCPYIYI